MVVKEYSPNMVILSIEPPKETGGVKVIGYRVEYDGNIQDFSIAGEMLVVQKLIGLVE